MIGHESSVRFRILGKFDTPTVLTKTLGFSPTRVSLIGYPINPKQTSKPIARVKRSCWEYEIELGKKEEMEDVICRILKKISLPKLANLRSHMPDIEVGFTYVVYTRDTMPPIFLSEDTVEELARYRAYINVDVMKLVARNEKPKK